MKNIIKDQEFWMILVFNIAIVVGYYMGETSASTIIILYYLQSILIGVQYFIRMLAIGFRNRKDEGVKAPYGVAFFFLFHFGFFHLVYFIFLLGMISDFGGFGDTDILKYLIFALFGNTVLSTVSDLKRDSQEKKSPAGVMFQPYIRIVPMHLLIMLGFNESAETISIVFIIFIILKSLADLLTHIVVNQTWKSERPKVTEGWIKSQPIQFFFG